MNTKAALAPAWVQLDPDTPEKEVAYRVRVGSEARLLPRRKEPVTLDSVIAFITLMTASDTHLDAVKNAEKVLGLKAWGHPGEGTEVLFKNYCRGRNLRDALKGLLQHANVFESWDDLCLNGAVRIDHLAISSNHPHAELRLVDGEGNRETIRFGERHLGYRDQVAPRLRINYLSGEFVSAIARLARPPVLQGKGQTETGTTSEDGSANSPSESENAAPARAASTQADQPKRSPARELHDLDNRVCVCVEQHRTASRLVARVPMVGAWETQTERHTRRGPPPTRSAHP